MVLWFSEWWYIVGWLYEVYVNQQKQVSCVEEQFGLMIIKKKSLFFHSANLESIKTNQFNYFHPLMIFPLWNWMRKKSLMCTVDKAAEGAKNTKPLEGVIRIGDGLKEQKTRIHYPWCWALEIELKWNWNILAKASQEYRLRNFGGSTRWPFHFSADVCLGLPGHLLTPLIAVQARFEPSILNFA